MQIVTIANQKGGVGKSTTTAMLGAELAARGYAVLLLDADPQSNLTEIFLDLTLVETSLANCLLGNATQSLASQRVTTEIEGLDLIPATISLANFDREPALSVAKLRSVLRQLSEPYHFVIIDTPPNLGLLLTAALTASTHVFVPVQAAPLALSGLRDLLDVVEKAREINEKLEFLGAACTMYDARTAISEASYRALLEALPRQCFSTIINRSAKLEEAPAMHQPIQLYARSSRAAQQYAALCDEFLKRIGVKAQRSKARRGVQ